MAKPVTIGSLSFRTQKEAETFYRDMRDKYGTGERVSESDADLLRELLKRHPEAEEKIGPGISFFTVEIDAKFGTTRHFMAHRVSGDSTDFSYPTCIKGDNPRRDILQALRVAIADQIVEFKSKSYRTELPRCPYTQHPVAPDDAHVDHAKPNTFSRLVELWLASEEISLSDVRITPSADNQIVPEMLDNQQVASWTTFHRAHATLRILSKRANLSHARKGED